MKFHLVPPTPIYTIFGHQKHEKNPTPERRLQTSRFITSNLDGDQESQNPRNLDMNKELEIVITVIVLLTGIAMIVFGGQASALTAHSGVNVQVNPISDDSLLYVEAQNQASLEPMTDNTDTAQIPSPSSTDEQASNPKTPQTSKGVKLELEPQKQYTRNGKAVYTITITDLHNSNIDQAFTYEISFTSSQQIQGEFSENALTSSNIQSSISEISLSAGQTKTISLRVKSSQYGTNVFSVTAKSKEESAIWDQAKGILIYSELKAEQSKSEQIELPDTAAQETIPLFIGEGYAIGSNTPAETAEKVSFSLMQTSGNVKGKMQLGANTYRLEGALRGNELNGNIYSANGPLAGAFSLVYKKVSTFDILAGKINLTVDNVIKNFDINAASKQQEEVIEKISPMPQQEVTVENVKPEKVIQIAKPSSSTNVNSISIRPAEPESEDSVYIRPLAVEKPTIFGIPIPFLSPKLKFEVIDGQTTIQKTLRANEKTRVGNYEISVGSLDNPNDLEISVKKSE